MVDLQESPAVPPSDEGGDERVGYLLAGSILIVLGWVVAVAVNLLLHLLAGTGGMNVGWMRITSDLGPYAWAVFAFGLVTGAVGLGTVVEGRAAPKGPFVLPGVDY